MKFFPFSELTIDQFLSKYRNKLYEDLQVTYAGEKAMTLINVNLSAIAQRLAEEHYIRTIVLDLDRIKESEPFMKQAPESMNSFLGTGITIEVPWMQYRIRFTGDPHIFRVMPTQMYFPEDPDYKIEVGEERVSFEFAVAAPSVAFEANHLTQIYI